MRLLLCCYADDETARQAFAKIGENWEKDVWGSKAFFDQCRSGSVKFGQPAMVTGRTLCIRTTWVPKHEKEADFAYRVRLSVVKARTEMDYCCGSGTGNFSLCVD
jgi:hypothetical protein